MYHAPDRKREFYTSTAADDAAFVSRGCGIPGDYADASGQQMKVPVITVDLYRVVASLRAYRLSILAAGLFLMISMLSWQGLSLAESQTQVATPIIFLETATNEEVVPLQFGSEPLLSKPDFFAQAYQAFVDTDSTFIKADLEAMQIFYYVSGEVREKFPIQAKGRPGSWWETPAGLYQVQDKRPRHRSSFAGVDLPWSMPFQGNFFIHGIPEYPDGTPVEASFSGGCIRLLTDDAEALFQQVSVGTPILVFARSKGTVDEFQYEPSIPDIATSHYLVADIGNNTILAGNELNQVVPIASITKLMTALVAAEHINLDQRVAVDSGNLSFSVVPRLSERQTVSMYSLLQLLLIESSNEAADLVANQIGREEFVRLMNRKADAIGMHNTAFADPSGLSAENVSTLSDLMRLAQYLYNNRRFILELTADQYVATAYDADAFGELNNFNILSELDNFYGGKTGQTSAAGQTSISLHRMMVRGEERLIVIAVLGSSDRTRDVLLLHSYFQERFVRH